MTKPSPCTDTYRLESQPFFEVLRDKLPIDRSFTQNLIECKDDMLFGWNAIDCCVVVFNWRLAQSKNDGNITCQTLIPSTPVDFTVTRLMASADGQYLALSGSRGIAVVEIPGRYGPNGLYKEGKARILCNTFVLDEHFLCTNQSVRIQQVRWHPAAPKDCTLLALLSNNSIRVYEESKLKRIWKIGPTPCAAPSSNASLPYLNSLGDTAVDFDIAAPRVFDAPSIDNSTLNETASTVGVSRPIEWPILILWANGDIYVALIGLDSDKPRLQGPLTMFPTQNDNYGLDSCSILAFQSNPMTIVVAQPNGRLYHMILVECDPFDQPPTTNDTFGEFSPANEWIINVVECVELELGLTGNADNHPIYLKADINNDSRYFAYHNTGVHAVTMEFLPELKNFFSDNTDTTLETALDKLAHAEYLVCTKALDNAKPNTVIGFTLFQSPSGLVTLLSSGQVVSLNVITNPSVLPQLKATSNGTDDNTNNAAISSKVFQTGSFDETIRQMLSAGTTQPVFKLDTSKKPSTKECVEFMLNSFQLLRDQYIIKHDRVRQKIENRVKILRILEQQQRQEIKELMVEKENLRENAEHLVDKYDEIGDKQQQIMQQLHEVHRLMNQRVPTASGAERNFVEQIEKICVATRELGNNIAVAKKKMEKQQLHRGPATTSTPKKDFILMPKQETVVKEMLAESNKQIETQIKEINYIKSVIKFDE